MTVGGYNIPDELRTLFNKSKFSSQSLVDLCSDDEDSRHLLYPKTQKKPEARRILSTRLDDVLKLPSDDEVEIVSDVMLLRREEHAFAEKNNQDSINKTNLNYGLERKKDVYLDEGSTDSGVKRHSFICIDSLHEQTQTDVEKIWHSSSQFESNENSTDVSFKKTFDEGVLFYRRAKSIGQPTITLPHFSNISQAILENQPQNVNKFIGSEWLTNEDINYDVNNIQEFRKIIRLNDPRVAKALNSIRNTPLQFLVKHDKVLAKLPHMQYRYKIPPNSEDRKKKNSSFEAAIDSNILHEKYECISKTLIDTTAKTYGEYKYHKQKLEQKNLRKSKCEQTSKIKNQSCHVNKVRNIMNEVVGESPGIISNCKLSSLAKDKLHNCLPHKKTASTEIISKTNKPFKALKCSVKGFDDPLKKIFTSPKRRFCSLQARSSLTLQLSESDVSLKRTRSTSPREVFSAKQLQNHNENVLINSFHNIGTLRSDKIKNCFVRLKRLPHEIYLEHVTKLNSYNQTMDRRSLHTELVVGTVKKTCDGNEPFRHRNKYKTKIYNTNIHMIEKTTKFCILCKSKSKNLTHHFVQFHKCESYIARLTKEALTHLIENIPYAELVEKTIEYSADDPIFAVECGFNCNQKLIMPFKELFDHYGKHTGEFAYECVECKISFPDKNEKHRHRKSKSCKGKKFRTVYLYPDKLETIYLHCCKLCNFVQLNEANTFKHLRDHHNKVYDDSTYIERVILCSIDNEYKNNKENINKTTCFTSLQSNDVIVNNEPLCLDSSILQLDGEERSPQSTVSSRL